MHRLFVPARLLPLLLAAACGNSAAVDLAWTSEGQVCVQPTNTEQVGLAADDPLEVAVTFGGCDCGEEITTKLCAAQREGDSFTVTSEATSIEDGCDPCEPIVAICELGPLSAGTYSIQHGGDLLILDVPGSLEDACTGEPTSGDAL